MNKWRKYFQPHRYLQWLKNKRRYFEIGLKKPLILTSSALGEKISFGIVSRKEYSIRYMLSYSRELTTMYWIENCVKQDDIVWDIGANVGAYTLLLGKRMRSRGGRGSIFAFEPESSNFYSLNRNIQLNQLSDIVTSVPLAFSRQFKLGEFFLSSNEPGSATHGLNTPESEGIEFLPTHRQGVLSMSVDQFVEMENAYFPNHIKLDVDGLEGEIIDSMSKTLSDTRLHSIVIEIATELSNGTIENKIIEAGFELSMEEQWDSKAGVIKNILFERLKD